MTTTETPSTSTARATAAAPTADAFAEELFGAVLGAQAVQAVYLGDRLGWYRALAAGDALTAPELAERTGTDARYAREWLEHQAVCGYVTVDDAGAAPDARRYSLPAAHAEVLTDADSLAYVAPLAVFVATCGAQIDAVADAYRTGGGVSWSAFGDGAREAQALANRPYFLHALAGDLAAGDERIAAVLRNGGRIADVGCGAGWSAIGLALANPAVHVDGYDLDAPSIAMARANAETFGVADRVRFHVVDAATVEVAEPYDLVTAFECIHDLPDPVAVLATMGRLAGAEGTVLVMDERTAETFSAPGDETERLFYGYSLMCCLPDGRSHQPSAATGTVMRPATLGAYAEQAGFAGTQVLPIENDFFRFYTLTRA